MYKYRNIKMLAVYNALWGWSHVCPFFIFSASRISSGIEPILDPSRYTLSTKTAKWTILGLNPDLCGEKPAANCLVSEQYQFELRDLTLFGPENIPNYRMSIV
jgi:hypothetical protein